MEKYLVLKVNDANNYLILSLSYESPLDDLVSLEKQLEIERVKGTIVFDLLLCNGISDNRYIELKFDGKHFQMDTIKVSRDIDMKRKEMAMDYYRNNPVYLQNSILPKAQVFLIMNGQYI